MNKQNQDYKKIHEWFLKYCKHKSLDSQTYDLKAKFDSSLNFNENKNLIKEDLKLLTKPQLNLSTAEIKTIKEQDENRRINEEKQLLKELTEKQNKQIQQIKTDLKLINTSRYFSTLENYIKMIAQDYSNGLIIKGSGGVGKSFSVIKVLNELNADYIFMTTFSTPLSLYKFLYEHKTELIVFDDVSGLITEEKSLSILKSALWNATNIRTINYFSTSEKLDIPSQFEFTGKIIICCNTLNEKDSHISSMKSRCLFLELNFSYQDIIQLFYEIAKLPYKKLSLDERIKIVDFVKENTTEATEQLNIRTLIHLFNLWDYSKNNNQDFIKLALNFLTIDDDLKILLEVENMETSSRNQKWVEMTGLSVRTLQRKLRILRKKRQSAKLLDTSGGS